MLSWTLDKDKIKDNQYNTAGFRSFLNRYADSGFRTKWSGIWVPPIKAFEYIAYSINGTWLSPGNITECSVKGWGAKNTYTPNTVETEGLDVSEIIFCPKEDPACISVLKVRNTTTKDMPVTITLEAAVNIREKHENIHDRKYITTFNDLRNALITGSELGSCIFGAGRTSTRPEVTYTPKNEYKNHNPGSPQVCFLPGEYRLSFTLGAGDEIKVPFIFAALKKICQPTPEGQKKHTEELIHTFDRCKTSWKDMLGEKVRDTIGTYHSSDIETPDRRLDKAFLWSQYSLKALINKSKVGTGIFAGYPWFLEFWGRDTFWSLEGLLDMGEFALARDIIKTLAQNQKDHIPCVLHLDGSTEYHGKDIDPLFLIALESYERKSGDKTLKKELAPAIKKALSKLELLDYNAVHGPLETWMDTLRREGTAVDIQALWVEALKTYEPKISMKMSTRLNRQFWNDDVSYYIDTHSRLPDTRVTSNGLMPMYFGLTPNDKAIKALAQAKSVLLCIYGIRTLSNTSKDYDPAGYHTGSTWGLTTGWGAIAFLRYGMVQEALQCLDAMAYDCEKYQPGSMSETVSSEDGRLLGTTHQAWSSALMIHAIDSHLFGIRPDMTENRITLSPQMPPVWGHMYRQGKTAGNHTFDIRIERTESGFDITLKFRDPPGKLRVEINAPESVTHIITGGKTHNTRSVTIPAEKETTIRCIETA